MVSLLPFAFPLLFPYAPPLKAIEIYQTHHVTKTSYIGNLGKNLQSLLEQQPCTYTILGWSAQEDLYYQSLCDGLLQYYIYDPSTSQTTTISSRPRDLVQERYPESELLELVRATGVRPKEHEPYTRPLYLVENTSTLSPNGSYIAFVTQRLYSVQDVVLITQ